MLTDEELRQGFTIGDWEVLPARGLLRSGRKEVAPEKKVFDVLMALARRDGDLVSNDEFVAEVWDSRPIGDDPLLRCISQLRRHLGDSKPYRYVENRPGRGYRLIPRVALAVPNEQSISPPTRLPLRPLLFGLLIAAAVVAGYIAWPSSPLASDEIRSIAVLPVENLGGDPDDQYRMSGFQFELVESLRTVQDLGVKPGRVSYRDVEVTEICSVLDVDAVLVVAVQRSGDVLKLSYNLAERNRGHTIAQGGFAGRLSDIFDLQVRLADMVREDLQGTVQQQLVSRSRPASFEAIESYWRGVHAFERRANSTNLRDAIALFEETIDLDPQFGPAYLSLATAYALLPGYEGEPLEASLKKAIDVAERGVAQDDSIRDAAAVVFGFVYHKGRDWIRAEQSYQRAISARVVDSNAFNWYARMLAGVGRREDALQQALAAHRLDPSSALINSLVATLYTWLGEDDSALEFYERARQLGAQNQYQFFGHALTLMRRGKLDRARDLASAGAEANAIDGGWIAPVFAAFGDKGPVDEAIDAVDKAVDEAQLDPRIAMALHTLYGDVDGAMLIADTLAKKAAHLEMDLLFLPELRPMREHPDFESLMRQLGVTDYWEAKGCLWLDDSVRCPD